MSCSSYILVRTSMYRSRFCVLVRTGTYWYIPVHTGTYYFARSCPGVLDSRCPGRPRRPRAPVTRHRPTVRADRHGVTVTAAGAEPGYPIPVPPASGVGSGGPGRVPRPGLQSANKEVPTRSLFETNHNVGRLNHLLLGASLFRRKS